MKNLVFAVCALLLSFNAFPQTTKGNYSLGAAIIFGRISENKSTDSYDGNAASTGSSKSSEFNLQPSVGYFFIDNLVAGISPRFYSNQTEAKVDDGSYSNETTSNEYSIGPFVRYYFGKSTKGRPFVSANTRIGKGKSTGEGLIQQAHMTTRFNSESSKRSFSTDLEGGYALFLNQTFMLNFFGGYSMIKTKETTESSYQSMNSKTESENRNGSIYFGISLTASFQRSRK